jgi:GGDEF domain-containing protein
VAGMKSGDRPVDTTNGAVESLQASNAPSVGVDAFSRELRPRTGRRRGPTAQARLDAAGQRDEIARARDLTALSRDLAADVRDLAMQDHDVVTAQEDGERAVTGAEIVIRAAGQRKRATRYRAQAAKQRQMAAEDRQRAARDRKQAALERLRALTDRDALAGQLATVETDALTGARALAAGLTDLDHEVDRCRATGGELGVAYVEVVAVEALGDSGDAAGNRVTDDMLTRVVDVIGDQLRSFDLLIRLGDDEFLCAMPNVTLVDIRERFSHVAAALAGAPCAGAIRLGFADLGPDDSAAQLIARAASELIDGRHGDR